MLLQRAKKRHLPVWLMAVLHLSLVISTWVLTDTVLCLADEGETFQPDQSALPAPPPKDAIVLLGSAQHQFLSMTGKAVDWEKGDGELISGKGNRRSNHIVSKWHFRDADIHVEFKLPEKGSGNSGIYIHGNYELQIFHSYGKTKHTDGDMGALYGFAPPLVNAARDRDQWQVYDIRYRAPRRNEKGEIVTNGQVTAWLNGQLVQKNTEFGEPRSKYHPFRYGTTPYLQEIWKRQKATMVGPVFLQDHDNPVTFRNVWIKPLDDFAVEYPTKKP